MVIFHSYVSHYQRVASPGFPSIFQPETAGSPCRIWDPGMRQAIARNLKESQNTLAPRISDVTSDVSEKPWEILYKYG